MSVFIKGLKLPTDCVGNCPFCETYGDFGNCKVIEDIEKREETLYDDDAIPAWCPMVKTSDGVLVKGMKLPEYCFGCHACYYDGGYHCVIADKEKQQQKLVCSKIGEETWFIKKPDWCPMEEIEDK